MFSIILHPTAQLHTAQLHMGLSHGASKANDGCLRSPCWKISNGCSMSILEDLPLWNMLTQKQALFHHIWKNVWHH